MVRNINTEQIGISPNKAIEIILRTPKELPIFLWGNTGIGKTQLHEQIQLMTGIPVLTSIAQTMTPIDFTGLPHIEKIGEKKFTQFSQPLFLPQEEEHGPVGILFLDEFPNATKSVQAAIQSLLTRGEYNGYYFPKEWKICLAGNRMTDRANTFDMPRPIRNRLLHINLQPDLASWQEWAAGSNVAITDTLKDMAGGNFRFPSGAPEEGDTRIHPMVRAFLTVHPQAFCVEDENAYAFATPRTWEYVSMVLRLNLPEDLNITIFQGLVGVGPAIEFQTFLQNNAILPDPRDLLTGKAKLIVEERNGQRCTILRNGTDTKLEASQMWALACSLASAVKDEKDFDPYFDVIENFHAREYGALSINEVWLRHGDIIQAKKFGQWGKFLRMRRTN